LHEAFNSALARCVQEHLRADDVRAQEFICRSDAAINVRLSGEVDYSVRAFVKRGEHFGSVSDVAAYEAVTFRVEVVEVVEISGVGERVEIDYFVAWRFVKQHSDERGTDESGAACDK